MAALLDILREILGSFSSYKIRYQAMLVERNQLRSKVKELEEQIAEAEGIADQMKESLAEWDSLTL